MLYDLPYVLQNMLLAKRHRRAADEPRPVGVRTVRTAPMVELPRLQARHVA